MLSEVFGNSPDLDSDLAAVAACFDNNGLSVVILADNNTHNAADSGNFITDLNAVTHLLLLFFLLVLRTDKHKVEDDHYIFYGDNCWRKEVIPKEHVVGIATKYNRKGRWIDADNIWLKIYAHIWCDPLIVRRAILRLRDEVKKVLRRVKKLWKKIKRSN